MTPRERLHTVLLGQLPDCVPVCPDISNMVPARLTGKPFWDIYLYNDPPIYDAYISAARRFDLDAFMDTFNVVFPGESDVPLAPGGQRLEPFIVLRTNERIVLQWSHVEDGKRVWTDWGTVYYRADSPSGGVKLDKLGLPPVPKRYEPVEGAKPLDMGPSGFKRIKQLMGDQGLIGTAVASSCALYSVDDIYNYYDHPEKHEEWAQQRVQAAEERFAKIMTMEVRPDFLCVGGSGSLVFQTPEIFRQLAFPAVKRAIELASQAGIPTHMHSCGPEALLVETMAQETGLTVIDPLEIEPMGDCDLASLKKLYGDRIVLKGNLHTTDVMLRGSVQDVVNASRKAIDDAAAGGRFILSTGDQCGRDTPDENLVAMVETARKYGRY